MRLGVKLLRVNMLRAHEKVSPQRVGVVKNSIERMGVLINPVIVDRKTKIVLDGHHRVESLRG